MKVIKSIKKRLKKLGKREDSKQIKRYLGSTKEYSPITFTKKSFLQNIGRDNKYPSVIRDSIFYGKPSIKKKLKIKNERKNKKS